MATLTLRSTKGSPLTIAEVDDNFSNLNTFKVELTGSTGSAILPVGTTSQRNESPSSGYLRFNSETAQFEGYNGTAWSSVGGATLQDDTTTNATYYPAIASATSGTALTLRTSSTKLTFNPSTGLLTATGFSGDGSQLTGVGATITDDNSTNATQYLGMSRPTSGAWTSAYISTTKLYFNPSTGTLNSTNFNSLSDASLKQNIRDIESPIQTINSITGVEFEWKDTNRKSAGVIAQRLEEVLPHLVEESTEGIKSVNYSGLVAYLIEAIKQQEKRLIELEIMINKT